MSGDLSILSLSAHNKHLHSHTQTHIRADVNAHAYARAALLTKTTKHPTSQSICLISAPKQNEAPRNNKSGEWRRRRNADRNENVIRSYHFLITQSTRCVSAGDGGEKSLSFSILIISLIQRLYCHSFQPSESGVPPGAARRSHRATRSPIKHQHTLCSN